MPVLSLSKGSPGRGARKAQCRPVQKGHDQKLRENTCGELVELLERIGRLREKTAVSHKTTVLRSLPMPTKTTPSVLTGNVNPKVLKRISTAAFTV